MLLALDSAFRRDTMLDSAFTGDSGLYVLTAEIAFTFIERASYVVNGADTTRVVGIEFDIEATQGGAPLTAGDSTINAKLMPDSSTTVTSAKDFGSGARALKVEIRGDLR